MDNRDLFYFRTNLNISMEQKYTTSIFNKIFYGAPAVGLFCFTLYLSFINHKSGSGEYVLVLISIIVMVMAIINLIKRKVIITGYSIKYSSIWGTRELENGQVKGFRTLDKRIVIYPTNDTGSKINIRDYLSIGGVEELREYLSKTYINLDAVSYQNNVDEILNNTELGINQDDRMGKFNRSKKLALIYNCGGAFIFITMLFFSEFEAKNDFVKIAMVLYPLVGMLLLALSKGLIKLVSGRNSAFGSVVVGMYTSTIVIFIIMIIDYHFLNYKNLTLSVLVIAIIIGGVLWRYGYDKSENAVKGQIVLLILISVFYACPLTIMLNCKLDHSAPFIYKSNILYRHVSNKNNRTYCNISISKSWDDNKDNFRDLQIDHELYDKLKTQDTVHVNVMQGLFKSPWFYITP